MIERDAGANMNPGEYFLDETAGPLLANQGRATTKVLVRNTGDRPVQVGSHFHFFEVNRELSFHRPTALGMRLNIAAGTAVRFEPGEEKEIELTAFAGTRMIHGANGLVDGPLEDSTIRAAALKRARQAGFKEEEGNQ
jgi:urease subunit beta